MSATFANVVTGILGIPAGAILALVNPNAGTLSKRAYWCIGPVLGTAAAAVAFNDVWAGLVFGLLILFIFGASYLRYHND